MRPGARSGLMPALAIGLLAGCMSSPQMARIDAHRDAYERWPIEMRQAILDGRVEPGMTPGMVAMAIGKPTQILNRDGPSGTSQDTIWVYRPPEEEPRPYTGGRGPGTLDSLAGYDPQAPRSSRGTTHESSGPPGPPIGSTLPRNTTPVADRLIVFRDGVVFRADPAPET